MKTITVSERDYGEAWPFTFPIGGIRNENGAIVIKDMRGRETYALNGLAIENDSYSDLDKVWRDDPKNPAAKISVSQFIAIGQRLR